MESTPGKYLSAEARHVVEEGLGFRPNHGRGLYFGRGRHHGRRFSLIPGTGLAYECGDRSYAIPHGSMVALEDAVLSALAGDEYAAYQALLGSLPIDGAGGSDAEFLALTVLALCLEEDPVMYLLLHHASIGAGVEDGAVALA